MRFLARVLAFAALSALVMPPTAAADNGLPPMTSTNAGPIIGAGASAPMSQQLIGLGNPNVQEVDGNDAAQFINAAAGISNTTLAAPFQLLKRGLLCQTNNAGFGARTYRRADGQWGGGMLVIAKSSTPDVEALKNCAKTNWRRAQAGGEAAMCNSGWNYPPFTDSRRGTEGYFVLLAGTSADFCASLNGKYKTDANGWPT